MAGVSVEVYGGPILATFADRDLTLAGRVIARDEGGALQSHLVHFEKPMLRLANPAIHLNRNVNEQGLRFDAQEELLPLLGALSDQVPPQRRFRDMLAEYLELDSAQILSWELAAADTQPAALFGIEQEYIAAPRLDNLASCHAAITALIDAADGGRSGVNLIALFDHEEVGSESYKGAQGSFLEDALARVGEALGISGSRYRQTLAKSLILSADMAHGFHPAYGRFYDNDHQVLVNGGPVIKINAKQRYATDAVAEAYFQDLCERYEIPSQKYVHRNDLPCGSTIGPITAARAGIRCIDVGNPMWSMHSARESAGARDHPHMIAAMTHFLGDG